MTTLNQTPNVQGVEEIYPMNEAMTNMDLVHATGKAFFEALAKWDGEELQGEIVADVVARHCTPESRLQLVFQALMNGHGNADDTLTKEGKMFAVDFADTIGPDNAQWLYHFAKLVTKLA